MFSKIKETAATLKSHKCNCEIPENYGYTDLVPDKVNHPEHYCKGKIEVIDIILDWKLDYLLGNVCKYLFRSPYKGEEIEDLKKAIWYLNKKIEILEAQSRP